ncbi:MAG: phosphate acyltransferase PlsX [Synergistaceae bacterium]|nr:phosphate acyltransferase PlsX [Synergistaceae bacterium]MBR0203578.1 phosphate acyltransferase PlsX [Synergistaceae bacterium]
MTIAVDAMGGDHAPGEICAGAVRACNEFQDIEIVLTGDSEKIKSCLESHPRIHIEHADEIIDPDEHPANAIRSKKNSSLRVAMEMVRRGDAQGCVSAGSTGAIVAGGVLVVGRLPGIIRPALGVPIPAVNERKVSFMLDVGATVRCKPENLLQFALMGNIYSQKILKVSNPEIKLLSNGSEDIKGDDTVLAARELIESKGGMNFQGYIEGNEVVFGKADVIVCDGFNGNIALKLGEGIMQALKALLTQEVKDSLMAKAGMLLLSPVVKRIWNRFNYEKYGGSPLLGVKGAVIKAHGRSKSPAVLSAISVARNFIYEDALSLINRDIEKFSSEVN